MHKATYFTDVDRFQGAKRLLEDQYGVDYVQLINVNDPKWEDKFHSLGNDLFVGKASDDVAEKLSSARMWLTIYWYDPKDGSMTRGRVANPWAICAKSVTRSEEGSKYERCVMDVKRSSGGWEIPETSQ